VPQHQQLKTYLSPTRYSLHPVASCRSILILRRFLPSDTDCKPRNRWLDGAPGRLLRPSELDGYIPRAHDFRFDRSVCDRSVSSGKRADVGQRRTQIRYSTNCRSAARNVPSRISQETGHTVLPTTAWDTHKGQVTKATTIRRLTSVSCWKHPMLTIEINQRS
jgi:hypothetical protein